MPSAVAQNFTRAAHRYDQSASVQADIAENLIAWAAQAHKAPDTILDLGCGTGFVTAAARRMWPTATITALDESDKMLHQLNHKFPDVRPIQGDAATIALNDRYDVILSSLMLHWLPEPEKILRRWINWLKPSGYLCVALLMEGSFQEWRDLCRDEGCAEGMWAFPKRNSFEDITQTRTQNLSVPYDSAYDFLRRLKNIGAATARPEHTPISTATMRKLLHKAPKPFNVTYQVIYITMQSASV